MQFFQIHERVSLWERMLWGTLCGTGREAGVPLSTSSLCGERNPSVSLGCSSGWSEPLGAYSQGFLDEA